MMPELRVNGITYYYEQMGKGKPLVFIAGYGANHTVWRFVYPAFLDNFQVLLFDNPSAGRTRDQGEALTTDAMAEGVSALISSLGLKNPHIIGHSMGGAIAQILAADYPDQIDRLVIVNSASRWNGRTLMAMQGLIDAIKCGASLNCQLEIIQPWLFGLKALNDPYRISSLREMILDNPIPPSIKDLERQYNALSSFDSSAKLNKIKAFTLVIISDDDILALPEESEEMAEKIPRSRIVRIPGGHASEYEEPDRLAQAIRRFLIIHN